jgi:plasmid stability protein
MYFWFQNGTMKTITLKNIPEDLLKRLKELAKHNNRSLNSEIIHILKGRYGAGEVAREEIMQKAKKIRDAMQFHLSDKILRQAKHEGRL